MEKYSLYPTIQENPSSLTHMLLCGETAIRVALLASFYGLTILSEARREIV